jgi:hypothetical protein
METEPTQQSTNGEGEQPDEQVSPTLCHTDAATAAAESRTRVEAIINTALDLTEHDLEMELANWRHDYLSIDRYRHSLESFVAIEDQLAKTVPGSEALRFITGCRELGGEGGAVACYTQFLCDYRLRRPWAVFPMILKAIWIGFASPAPTAICISEASCRTASPVTDVSAINSPTERGLTISDGRSREADSA